MSDVDPTGERYVRLAPELRRCAIYVIVGFGFIAPAGAWIGLFVQQRPLLRWCLRINAAGIARRRLFVWDHWKWSDFSSGEIHKRSGLTFHDPRRPWWRRRLRLGYMSGDDGAVVLDLINAHYQLPPPPEIPEVLTVKYGSRRSASFDENGIHLIVRGNLREHLWSELRRVRITRYDPLRRDFKTMELFLPEEVIQLRMVTHQGGTSPTWRGATAEQIDEFLRQYVSADRIDVEMVGDDPKRREDVQRALQAAKKSEREFRMMLWMFGSLIAAALIWVVWNRGVVVAMFMAVLYAIFPVVFLYFFRLIRQRRRKLEELFAELDESALP